MKYYYKQRTAGRALLIAVEENYLPHVQMAIADGANVRSKRNRKRDKMEGFTVLHRARSVAIAKALIDAGARIEAEDSQGRTPIFFVPADVASLLIGLGAQADTYDCYSITPMHCADSFEKVMVLARAGALIDATDCVNGRTALHTVDDVGAMRALIALGAEIDTPAQDGWTPLHYAIYSGNSECCEVLLRAGADPMALTTDGSSCIDYAARASDDQLVHAMNVVVANREAQKLNAGTVQVGSWSPSPSDMSGDDLLPTGNSQAQPQVQRQTNVRRL